jgi:hypothetical protein
MEVEVALDVRLVCASSVTGPGAAVAVVMALADADRSCARRAGRRVELVEVALRAAWVRELVGWHGAAAIAGWRRAAR